MEPAAAETLTCTVERITYKNEVNGYAVIKAKVRGYADVVPIVGILASVKPGAVLLAKGRWETNEKYGRQFRAFSYQEQTPSDVAGIEKYLGSGLIKGIGPKFAKRIVAVFGADTLKVIDETPQRLTEVKGLGKRKADSIIKSWDEQREVRNIMLFLQSYDVSPSYAHRIYKTYGNDSIAAVKENPFRLADDIWGIGFKTADGIARKMGFGTEDYVRIRSGILYTLNRLAGDEGHVYADRTLLVRSGTELLGASGECISAALDQMIQAKDVTLEDGAIYLPVFFNAERGTARRLAAVIFTPASQIPGNLVEDAIRNSPMQYDRIQADAIRTASRSKVMVLTGGPGTGKTTTTQGIIAMYRSCGLDVRLAAPTGRAARRMSEATGLEAKTIHRLLEYSPMEGCKRNENNPLEGDALIVDECSMIDLMLMKDLVKAVPLTMRLVLVGDVDQLPSVGAGSVLRDIIDSGVCPVVRLQRIFRQAQNSMIVTNAHRVNRGQWPDVSRRPGADFFFLKTESDEEAADTITDLVKNRLPRAYHMKPGTIQVLTPIRRGVCGSSNLNSLLQTALNPAGPSLKRSGVEYRLYDKVMQIRNNYEKDVFNGDLGRITAVDEEAQTLTVTFDGRPVEYETADLDELVLSYAATIHKSQGSEYPYVIIPVLTSHYKMLQRNLLYTGITRAKKLLILVGTDRALGICIRTVSSIKRNTRLAERLREASEPYLRSRQSSSSGQENPAGS